MALIPVNFGGGSGSGSDDCTAKAEHVLAPYTAITSDSDDEPIEGTLQDKSGTTQQATSSLDSANSRLQMTIPTTAKYSTASKLYAAYSAIRSLIGLTADKLWTGVTILGMKSTRSALGAKTYTPGTSNQTISSGICLTGAQTIKGDSNLKAANIKKGVTIFGIAGTWEGYVAAATDLYKLGANAASFTLNNSLLDGAYCNFETTYIDIYPATTANNSIDILSSKSYNFAGYSSLKIQYKCTSANTVNSDYKKITLSRNGSSVRSVLCGNGTSGGTKTVSISLANLQTTFTPKILFITRGEKWQIQRIWIE